MKTQLIIFGLFVATFAQSDELSEGEIWERHHYRSRHRNEKLNAVTGDNVELEASIPDEVMMEKEKGIGYQRYKRHTAHGNHIQYDENGNTIQPWDSKFVHSCIWHDSHGFGMHSGVNHDCSTSTSTTTTTTTTTTTPPPTTKGPTMEPYLVYDPRMNPDYY